MDSWRESGRRDWTLLAREEKVVEGAVGGINYFEGPCLGFCWRRSESVGVRFVEDQ